MIDAAASPEPRIGLLLRMKARGAYNAARKTALEAPVRASAAVILVGVIWIGLYFLFNAVFVQLRRTQLEATVAIPLVFNFFFVAMLALLTLSNAIIAYSALFGRAESSYLLTLPLSSLDVVTLKYLESLFFSSWSLVLLGMPLMLAMADQAREPLFYILFIAFFLAFIPIPGAAGIALAWLTARYFPRRWAAALVIAGGVAVAAFSVWGLRVLRIGDMPADEWLRAFLAKMSFVENVLLPNNWVSRGIDNALHGDSAVAAMYLGVTCTNALFLSWLAVTLVSSRFEKALDRASSHGHASRRFAAPASGGLAGMVFFYLSKPLRLVAAKDLRTFLRDPLQWSQLLILFGLLILYLWNMPTMRIDFSGSEWSLAIPFLNLCAVSLILATFTCRFVFPLVSLEGRQLWLIGVLPLNRGRVLIAKFAFAMTVTVLVAVGAMTFGSIMLGMHPVWAATHIAATVSICFGLCGFAVGIGARLPMFGQSNAARIANGVGGTVNLLASVALVGVVLVGIGMATYRSQGSGEVHPPDLVAWMWIAASLAFGVIAGGTAMMIGARHFRRVEV